MSGEDRMRPDAGQDETIQLISVRIDGQLIGLPIMAVRDVFALQGLTPVPRADSAIAGLVNLRGYIVTIIDLGELLSDGGRGQTLGKEKMAVGVEWQGEVFGLIVDEIGDVLSLAIHASEAMPTNMNKSWAKHTRRVHKLETELMIEIDLQALLNTMTFQAT